MGKTFKDDKYFKSYIIKSRKVSKRVKKEMKRSRNKMKEFDEPLPPSYAKKVLADRWNWD